MMLCMPVNRLMIAEVRTAARYGRVVTLPWRQREGDKGMTIINHRCAVLGKPIAAFVVAGAA